MARVPHRETSDKTQRERFNRALEQLERRIDALERRDGQADSASPDRPGVDYLIALGFDTGNTLVYLPLNLDTVPNASINEGWVNWLAPWRCKVVEVVLLNITVSYGSTTITTHIDGSTTASDTDTKDLNIGTDAVHFELGTRLEAGQRLAIGFLATVAGAETTGYVRIRRID